MQTFFPMYTNKGINLLKISSITIINLKDIHNLATCN